MSLLRRFLLIVGFVIVLSACAVIVHGPYQDISVNTVPSGVTVEVLGRIYTTPATIEMKRDDPPVILKFSKEGYESIFFVLDKKVDSWIFGNIIFGVIGGIPGLLVDFATGAAYIIKPDNVDVTISNPETQALIWIFIEPDKLMLRF